MSDQDRAEILSKAGNGPRGTWLERSIHMHCRTAGYPRDTAARLRKLCEEVGELAEAIARGDRAGIAEEGADVGIVLADILALNGVSLTAAMAAKLEVIK